MEDLSSTPKKFFNHVFNFEEKSKSEISNILQYALLSVIPLMILNKTMEIYVPNEDESKSTIEIEYSKSLPTTPEIDKSFSDFIQEEKKKKNNLKVSKSANNKKA